MTWTCCFCGCTDANRPKRWCPRCGTVQVSVDTRHKYEVLGKYCHPLSLIMRNHGIPHYFVDACAGSGIVQGWDDKPADGSPLIMAKTREHVDGKIKDKGRDEESKCVFIEYDHKTFAALVKNTEPYQSYCTRIRGDANEVLPVQLATVVKDAFALIYIDPFGMGDPVIKFETVKQVLERKRTELFIHFSLEAVERSAGMLQHVDSDDSTLRAKARGSVNTLDLYMNGQEWRDVWTRSRSPSERRRELMDLYLTSLQRYYPHVQHMAIPIGEDNPETYLVFTTRNETGSKIMSNIMDKARRDGAESIARWFG